MTRARLFRVLDRCLPPSQPAPEEAGASGATAQLTRPVGLRFRGSGACMGAAGGLESAADVHEAAAWLAHTEAMRLDAAASATRPQPIAVDEDVHHPGTTIAWNLLTDRDALDALVGQLTPALSTVPSDVVAAATALAKVMLGPGFGCPLHSLRWVFALLQQIPVTPADSEFVPRPQPNGTGCTQVLRRLPSDECSQPHQRAVLCEVSGDAEASFEFRLSGCMLGQRLVGVCEVRIGGSDGVLHAGPAPAPDTAQGCLAQVHAVGPAGIIAVLCTRCFRTVLPGTEWCPQCEPARPGPPTRTPPKRRARESSFQQAASLARRRRATTPAIEECTVLDAPRRIVAVPRRLNPDLAVASGKRTYCIVSCEACWSCTGCKATAGACVMPPP